jgi:hypothetical protein
MRDLHNNVAAKVVVAAVAGAATGKVIDTQGYQGVEFIINYGTVTATNATVTPVIKEGSVTGTLTSVADADLLGLEANAAIAVAATRTSGVSKNVVKRVGYIGSKRYVSCNILQTVTAAAPVSVTAVLNKPNNAPVAT